MPRRERFATRSMGSANGWHGRGPCKCIVSGAELTIVSSHEVVTGDGGRPARTVGDVLRVRSLARDKRATRPHPQRGLRPWHAL